MLNIVENGLRLVSNEQIREIGELLERLDRIKYWCAAFRINREGMIPSSVSRIQVPMQKYKQRQI